MSPCPPRITKAMACCPTSPPIRRSMSFFLKTQSRCLAGHGGGSLIRFVRSVRCPLAFNRPGDAGTWGHCRKALLHQWPAARNRPRDRGDKAEISGDRTAAAWITGGKWRCDPTLAGPVPGAVCRVCPHSTEGRGSSNGPVPGHPPSPTRCGLLARVGNQRREAKGPAAEAVGIRLSFRAAFFVQERPHGGSPEK